MALHARHGQHILHNEIAIFRLRSGERVTSTARLILLSANQWQNLEVPPKYFIGFRLQGRAGTLCHIGAGRRRRFITMNDTLEYIDPADPLRHR